MVWTYHKITVIIVNRKGCFMMKKNKGQMLESSIKKSQYKGFFGIIKEFIDDINSDDIGIYAAQSAFYITLSAVPSIMLIIMTLKYFIEFDIQSVIDTIARTLPTEISKFLADLISEVFYRSESTAVFSVAFITLSWTSSKGTMAIYRCLNKIYGYTKKLSWTRMRVMSLLYNLLLVAVIVASVVVLVFGNAILSFFDSEFLFAHYIISLFLQFKFVIFFVLFMLGFAALFTFLPQRKIKYSIQLWGGGVTALGWLGISYGFSLYIEHFPRFSYIYGSLTTIMLLMLWLFFGMYMLLIGAEINKHIESGYFRRFAMRVLRLRAKKRKKM